MFKFLLYEYLCRYSTISPWHPHAYLSCLVENPNQLGSVILHLQFAPKRWSPELRNGEIWRGGTWFSERQRRDSISLSLSPSPRDSGVPYLELGTNTVFCSKHVHVNQCNLCCNIFWNTHPLNRQQIDEREHLHKKYCKTFPWVEIVCINTYIQIHNIYIYMYIYIYVHIYTHTHTHIYIYTCIYTRIYRILYNYIII